MNLIDIFIGDELELGMENLYQVEIFDYLKEKFKKEDEEDEKEYIVEKFSQMECVEIFLFQLKEM